MTTGTEDGATSRRRAIVTSWVAYATYYLGRKNFSAIKRLLELEFGVSPTVLGAIDTANLAAYAVGQFASGPGKLAQDEHAIVVDAARHVLLRHEVHAVVE